MKKALLSFCVIFFYQLLVAQTTSPTTFNYTTLDGQPLALDLYSSSTKKKKNPTVLFVHGGSFMNGSKNSAYVAPFAKKMNEAGINLISIDYRLTLKGKSFHCDCPASEKIRTFEQAVYDIRAATKYILDNKKSLGINSKKIILAGNSAGAEAVLHAAFWANKEHNVGTPMLKNSFKYAGVVAYAGAIIDTNLITKKNKLPAALYHGTCDQYVPYKTAAHHFCPDSTVGALVLSGSLDIMKRLINLNGSYFCYSQCYGNHNVNVTSMETQIDNTIAFIKQSILRKKLSQKHLIEQSSGEKCKFVHTALCQ